MRIRIRLGRGRPLRRGSVNLRSLHPPVARRRFAKPAPVDSPKVRDLAHVLGALLTPAALMAYVLGFWRLAADMGVAGQFGITGFFSHWQIWILMGALLQFSGRALTKFGHDGELPRMTPLLLFTLSDRDRKPDPAAAAQREVRLR